MILNLTQHKATPEQVAAGVVEPANKAEIQRLLTFGVIPTAQDIRQRAEDLARLASDSGCKTVMVGGAPYLMGPLVEALKSKGIEAVFSFTERVSIETQNPDGTTTKTSVFKHVGWVSA